MAPSDSRNAENLSGKVPPMKERSTNQDAYPPAQSVNAAVTASALHPSNSGEALAKKRNVSFEEQRKPRIAGASMAAASDARGHARTRDDKGDSSADERTGMLGRARDGNKDYRTADTTSSNNTNSTGGGRERGGGGGAGADAGGGGGKATRTATTENSDSDSQAQPRWLRRRKGKRKQENEHRTQEKAERWWSTLLEKYGSVELENKGSVARDHLALERTFLAWLRTSLSFASIGIAITQLFRLNVSLQSGDSSPIRRNHLHHVGKPLGATFIAIAIVILFIGFHRYFESQHYIIRGKFPASRGSIFIITLVAGLLIVASLILILSLAKGTFD